MARKEGEENPRPEDGARAPIDPPTLHRAQTVALFVILSAFWLLLSQRIGIQYLLFMLAAVGIVLWTNPERPLPSLDPTRGTGARGIPGAAFRLMRYLGWLIWNVVKANIDVARIILHPKLPVDPMLMEFRTTLRSDLAKVVVANSITLTPGTVTIDLKGDRYLVHALHPDTAGAVVSGELQNVVGAVFGEDTDPAPEVHWSSDFRDLHA